ncbi:MAG: TrkH family potassium uptake protein [Porphyromonas sp.]|nr:TrkH family potassium uptake protein [Porphyromonas sp.]
MNLVVHEKRPSSRRESTLNYWFVLKIIGTLALIQIPFLLISLGFSYYYKDTAHVSLWTTVAVASIIGLSMVYLGRRSNRASIGRKESMITVSLSWLIVSLIGMLPYLLGGYLPSFTDAYLEAVSGYTTTGITTISDLSKIPRSILFWRSITQWQGGIGIIVVLVALVPMTGESASMVFNNETTGITHERFVPRISVMAKWIILLYLLWTAVGTLLLVLGPLGLFDAICHAATGIATGGFSTYNDSIARFDIYSQTVLTIIMIIGATSFTLVYYAVVRRDPKKLFGNQEFRAFAMILLVVSLVGGLWLHYGMSYYNLPRSWFKSLVQIVSAITSTGFSAGPYNHWGTFFIILLFLVMFIGGCSGSTAGGLKVIRIMVLLRATGVEFKKRVHPNAVIPVRIGKQVVTRPVVMQIFNFFFLYILVMTIAALLLSLEGRSLMESYGTALTCISNAGCTFGELGVEKSFTILSGANKLMLCLVMIIGRLEIFTVLTMLQPSFWKH